MAKYKALGAALQRDIAGTFTTVAQVASIGDHAITREIIDMTSHDSAGGFREHIGSLRDQEEFDITILYDPDDASHDYFLDEATTGTNDSGETFRIILSGASGITQDTWSFTAIVAGFTLSGREIDGRLEAVITFKPTGAPNFNPA